MILPCNTAILRSNMTVRQTSYVIFPICFQLGNSKPFVVSLFILLTELIVFFIFMAINLNTLAKKLTTTKGKSVLKKMLKIKRAMTVDGVCYNLTNPKKIKIIG